MEVITSHNIIHIVRRALGYVDERLMGHGERVAYIVYKMLCMKGDVSEKHLREILLTTLLHDIGAYKTEEIDRMVEFETKTVWEHSVYGYLYLSRFSPLKEYADAVLYHHLPYKDFEHPQAANARLALLIKLADRIDTSTSGGALSLSSDYLLRGKGVLFAPDQVELFFQAQKAFDILGHLHTGDYLLEWDAFMGNAAFSGQEKEDYLRMIAFAVDFRSECTVLHTVTTVYVSCSIARLMGMDEEDVARIYYGALLHDIGKVATPVAILEKTGKLTDAEMAIMRHHVDITGEILGDYVYSDVYQIAMRHHEKCDGSGYPLGLTGAELSKAERIVAVADIISALVCKRSYKEAFERGAVLDILREMTDSGKLCPKITPFVIEHYDSVMEEANRRGEEMTAIYRQVKADYTRIMDTISHTVKNMAP